MCSTPDGIGDDFTPAGCKALSVSQMCSTPDGIGDDFTSFRKVGPDGEIKVLNA